MNFRVKNVFERVEIIQGKNEFVLIAVSLGSTTTWFCKTNLISLNDKVEQQ